MTTQYITIESVEATIKACKEDIRLCKIAIANLTTNPNPLLTKEQLATQEEKWRVSLSEEFGRLEAYKMYRKALKGGK